MLKINETRLIYLDLPNYQELLQPDKDFFDWIFYQILYSNNFQSSNKEIAVATATSISTIEKRMNRLDKSNLIKRKTYAAKLNGDWINYRTIYLNALLFPAICTQNVEYNIKMAENMVSELRPKDKKSKGSVSFGGKRPWIK